MHTHVDPLDQKLHDARLLDREERVPKWVELLQRLPRLVLGDVILLGPHCAPRADDDVGLPENAAQLVDDRTLDLRRRHATDRASLGSALQRCRTVEPRALPGVRRRHGGTGRPEDQPLQQRRRLRPGARGPGADFSARIACTLSPRSCVMIASCSPSYAVPLCTAIPT